MNRRCRETRRKKALFFLLVFLLLSGQVVSAAAASADDYGAAFSELGGDRFFAALPEQVQRALAEAGITDGAKEALLQLGVTDFLSIAKTALAGAMTEPLRAFAALLGLVLLTAVLEQFCKKESKTGWNRLFALLEQAAMAGAVALPVSRCIAQTDTLIQTVEGLMLVFLPIFCGVLAAAGQGALSMVCSGFLYAGLSGGVFLLQRVLLPFVRIYFLFVLLGSGDEELGVMSAANRLRKGVGWGFSGAVSLLLGLWSIQKNIAFAADSAALRTGKAVLSGVVPVVGSALSDAASGLSGCLLLVKNTMGGQAIFSLFILFLPVFAETLCWLVLCFSAQAAAKLLGNETAAKLLIGAAEAEKFLLAVISVSAAFLFLALGMLLGGNGG